MVASKVRSLARSSAAVAKEIKVQIDDSAGKVAMGSRLVDEAGGMGDEMAVAYELCQSNPCFSAAG